MLRQFLTLNQFKFENTQKMLRDSKLRVKSRKRKFHPIQDISYKAVHLSVKRMNNRVYIKKLLWLKFENEKCYQAIPWEHLDYETQEKTKCWFNSCRTIEFAPHEISQDRRCIEANHK